MKVYDYSKSFNIEDFEKDHEMVLSNIKSDITIEPDEIMCCSDESIVYFVELKNIRKLWTDFTKVVTPEPNLDIYNFIDYGEIFYRYFAKRTFGEQWYKKRYFINFIEVTYDIYKGKDMKTYDYSKKFNIEDFSNDHEMVLNNIVTEIKIEPDEIMAFSKDDIVFFLKKERLEELWIKFTEVIAPEHGLELNDFHDEYGELFFRYVARQIFEKEWKNIRYFCNFIESTYYIYRGEI